MEKINFQFDMHSINTFFQNQGVNMAAEDSARLNTIFKECDTEGAINDKGEKTGDGVLNGQERMTFLNKIKNACPQIYNKIVDFLRAVDAKENDEANKKETLNEIEKEENIKNTGNYKANIQQWQEETAKEVEKANVETMKEIERQELILNFEAKWTIKIDNKILTAQLKELENISDKENLDKKLMEFNTQNQNQKQSVKNNIKFGLDS